MASSVWYWPARVSASVRTALVSRGLARTARRRASSPSSTRPCWKQSWAKNSECSGLADVAARSSRPALMASSTRPSRDSSRAMPVEVLGAVAAVDLRQPAQGLGGVAQVAGRLAHPGRQRPGRDRAAVDRDRAVGRAGPPRGACRRPRGTGPARSSAPAAVRAAASSSLPHRLDPRRQPAGRLVVLHPRFPHGRSSARPARPAWRRRRAGSRRRRTGPADAR